MLQLVGIRIRNFKCLSDMTLGTFYGKGEPLPPLCCFIGPNGCGKSTLLDAFAFISDSLKEGVEAACNKLHRGGFTRLRTQGSEGPIRFHLLYTESGNSSPIIDYVFVIDEKNGIPIVSKEEILQLRGRNTVFLDLTEGAGELLEDEKKKLEDIRLENKDRLGITSLGQISKYEHIVSLRKYIESWYLSYFVPDAARRLPPAGAQKHLDRTGENLGNVLQYMERSHPERLARILERISKRIPGIQQIRTQKSPDGRLLLQFNEKGYTDPFYQQSMSDGTLKMFAYLLLLEDPEPPAFIAIEEPENGLYHKLLEELAREFRQYAENSKGKSQILLTTHSPYFIDSLSPEQVWLMEKDEKGHTQVKRTSDMPAIKELESEGIPLGSLWYSNHFEERFGR